MIQSQCKAINLRVTKANVAAVANPVTRTILGQDRRIIFTLIVRPDLISLFTLSRYFHASRNHIPHLQPATCMLHDVAHAFAIRFVFPSACGCQKIKTMRVSISASNLGQPLSIQFFLFCKNCVAYIILLH